MNTTAQAKVNAAINKKAMAKNKNVKIPTKAEKPVTRVLPQATIKTEGAEVTTFLTESYLVIVVPLNKKRA